MPAVEHEDIVVYAHPDGRDYVANFPEDGWFKWPAEHQGWTRRQSCQESLADECEELEPRLAHLALRLSGVVEP
jgi:hypothetical protein